MKKTILLGICFLFTFAVGFAQSEPLIGGYYINGVGSIGVFVGPKQIAKIVVTLSAKDEYEREVSFSTEKTIIGPMLSYCSYENKLSYGTMGRYPIGYISRIVIYFSDQTKKTYGRKESARLTKDYFAYIGRGY